MGLPNRNSGAHSGDNPESIACWEPDMLDSCCLLVVFWCAQWFPEESGERNNRHKPPNNKSLLDVLCTAAPQMTGPTWVGSISRGLVADTKHLLGGLQKEFNRVGGIICS